jgi:hypothetical protein
MTDKEIEAWSKRAKPGDTIAYRTGRQLSRTPKVEELDGAVHAVRHLYNLGKVILFQRRVGKDFEYVAQWRAKVSPPVPAFTIEGQAIHRFRIPSEYVAR